MFYIVHSILISAKIAKSLDLSAEGSMPYYCLHNGSGASPSYRYTSVKVHRHPFRLAAYGIFRTPSLSSLRLLPSYSYKCTCRKDWVGVWPSQCYGSYSISSRDLPAFERGAE